MTRVKAWHLPLRLATGAYVLNSGVSRRPIEEEAARGLHGFALSGWPELANMHPMAFANMLSWWEIALGSSLLLPLVPSWLAGAGLAAFASGLMRLYLKSPGLREEGSLKPSQHGIPLAKDSWMLAIGLALLIDAASSRRG